MSAENDRGSIIPLHAVVAVVDANLCEKTIHLCQEAGVLIHLVSLCHGTARTEMLDLLGLGETKKGAVFCLIPSETVPGLLTCLADGMQMRYPGKGIAFAVPLNSVNGKLYRAVTTWSENNAQETTGKERTQVDEPKRKYEVVVTVINHGYTNLVMDAARQVGARGGTVLSARGIAREEVEQFLGVSIQAEKEVVFMVVESETRLNVMKAISETAGLKTPGKGVVFSLPVSDAIGLA